MQKKKHPTGLFNEPSFVLTIMYWLVITNLTTRRRTGQVGKMVLKELVAQFSKRVCVIQNIIT